ncbi:MAG: helix-turn-helix transcriptional regulator [Terriglobia bacterium]
MNVALVIRQRLEQLEIEQRDLATAAQVTESYISQLLTGRKAPPAPERTGIYEKMADFLKLPRAELVKLADLQRKEELKKKIGDPPAPLFKEVRALILRKCVPGKQKEVRAIFEKQPFGELERLVTQKLLDVAKRIAREELQSEERLRAVARLTGRSYERLRVIVLDFLDIDIFNISVENCVAFLDPLIEAWDIDLASFGMEITLNRRMVRGQPRRFEFMEKEREQPPKQEPGFRKFLHDRSLSGNATPDEIAFLRKLQIKGKRPTPLYYYRELQSLRDPLHFRIP